MTTTITGLRAERAVPAKSGRSFDFAGFRVRLEAGHGDDRVPAIVDYLVERINEPTADDLVALINAGDLLAELANDDDVPEYRRNQARDLARTIGQIVDRKLG